MAARPPRKRGRSEADRRRRTLGQNLLADGPHLRRVLDDLGDLDDRLVVDLGAGRGALALALAERGARVWAVEVDGHLADDLRRRGAERGLDGRIRLIRTDLRRLRLPREPYRVVANPPFGLTTTVLSLLLDEPGRGPERADLVLEAGVVAKHTTTPPAALRTAAWAPWWRFEAGVALPRTAFRPAPRVDARVLRIVQRDPPILPTALAPDFRATLRPAWADGPDR